MAHTEAQTLMLQVLETCRSWEEQQLGAREDDSDGRHVLSDALLEKRLLNNAAVLNEQLMGKLRAYKTVDVRSAYSLHSAIRKQKLDTPIDYQGLLDSLDGSWRDVLRYYSFLSGLTPQSVARERAALGFKTPDLSGKGEDFITNLLEMLADSVGNYRREQSRRVDYWERDTYSTPDFHPVGVGSSTSSSSSSGSSCG